MTDAQERIYWTPIPFSKKHDRELDAVGFAWLNDDFKRVEYIRADIHQAALQAAYAEGLEAAARAVAVTVAPVQGTPYIIGPSKFCEAIRALPNKYEVK